MSSNSYKTIVKSTSVIGIAQVINILFRIIKNKLISLLIGSKGLGLISTYNSTIGLVTSVSGLGVGFSGVREIAEADASGEEEIIGKTAITLRRITVLLGLTGSLLAIILSKTLSRFTFGSEEYTSEIRILSIVVFLTVVSTGQSALIQGKRRIKDLAKLSILGTLFGLILGIPVIYYFKIKGIIPFIIIIAALQFLASWWFAGKIKITKISLGIKETFIKSKSFIKLGFAFMLSGFAAMAAQYLIRVIIINKLNIEAVGIFQAANTISVLYIGIILDAMGKDYYPRLTAIVKDREDAIQSINEQTEIGILLALPGLLVTLIFAPFLIKLFYTAEFDVAYQILRWQILGIFLRVISWPIGFYFPAKGMGNVFLLSQIFFNTMYVILTFLGIYLYKIIGIGIAFFVLYGIHFFVIYSLGSFYFKFKWVQKVKKLLIVSFLVILMVFILLNYVKLLLGIFLGSLITIAVSVYVIKQLMLIFNIYSFKNLLQITLKKIRR